MAMSGKKTGSGGCDAVTVNCPDGIGEALKGSRLSNFWNYRVGDNRIISSIEDGALRILVVKIGNRREVCRSK